MENINQDIKNLIISFKPGLLPQDIKVGTLCDYREGMVKARVEVLENNIKNDNIIIKLKVLESKYFKKDNTFEVGVKIGYENTMGVWRLMPIPELN